ncbi:MAG TPA: Rpp14/Pop5 family protein [Thermoplasmata archaeon]|nr:Rpp14/Pop5 family protein [Thermoplasmata archaeon]
MRDGSPQRGRGGGDRGGGGRRATGGRGRPSQAPLLRKSKRPRFRYILVRVEGPPIPRLTGDVVGSEVSNSSHRVPGCDPKLVESSGNHAILRIRRGTEGAVRAAVNHPFKVRDQEFRMRSVTTSGTLKALRERGGLPARPAQWKMRRQADMRRRGR